MTAQNNEQHMPSLTNPISALHRAIEEANLFKVQMTERLKKLLQQHAVLHARNDSLEQENRTLKARLAGAESDVKRLTRDNEVLTRNQQMLDVAIQSACGTFMETTAFVSEATNSSISSLPLPLPLSAEAAPKPAAQRQPQVSVSKPQPLATASAPSAPAAPTDDGSLPRLGIKPLEAYVAQTAAKPLVDIGNEDALKAMTDEIDRLLSQDVIALNEGTDGESAPAEGEAKAT